MLEEFQVITALIILIILLSLLNNNIYFQAAKCEVVAVSVDSEFSHLNWTNTPRYSTIHYPPDLDPSFVLVMVLFSRI